MYTKLECLCAEGNRSPVVFIHGFPDSPLMFQRYYAPEERDQAWLQGRPIYTVAFPNRFTNPNYPPLSALISEVLQKEVEALLSQLIAASPTGQIVPVVHDWGATCTWKFIRKHDGAGIEKIVAFSVASSFRYDIWEHGFRALAWTYSLLFGSAWYIRIPAYQRFVTGLITRAAGYHSDQDATLWKDCFHYWYGLPRLLIVPFDLIGLRYRPAYTDFKFPVLFIRSPLDRMPSTAAFEKALKSRPDCRFVVYEDANHWFPEQHAERVLKEVRAFV